MAIRKTALLLDDDLVAQCKALLGTGLFCTSRGEITPPPTPTPFLAGMAS